MATDPPKNVEREPSDRFAERYGRDEYDDATCFDCPHPEECVAVERCALGVAKLRDTHFVCPGLNHLDMRERLVPRGESCPYCAERFGEVRRVYTNDYEESYVDDHV